MLLGRIVELVFPTGVTNQLYEMGPILTQVPVDVSVIVSPTNPCTIGLGCK